MKKKKRIIIGLSIMCVILICITLILITNKSSSKVLDSDLDNTKVENKVPGMFAIMLETQAGSGQYQESTSSLWPGDGYIYNETLSRCENGGELTWHEDTRTVSLKTSGSDKCYVYFDKYNVAKITNVTNTKTTNSVTLTVTTEAGENPIEKYYFSKDNGSSYVESTSQTYTFTGLTPNTTYTFKVYAKDTLGYETNEETVQVTTNAYVNPVVNSITVTDTTTNSISIRVSASGGTNSVATYYYSINNGAYTSSTSNTKTFTGLSKGTTYTIKVYVKDTNGVDSSIKTTSAETENTVLLADYIKGLYTSQGTNGIYYHTSSLVNSAADNSYRYAGANPNNYVCFGSDVAPCPSDNLYRIIGVFGSEVKLIKNTSIGNNYWSGSSSNSSNTWSNSTLNTGTLNGTYLNGLGSTWSNKIANHNWKVGGMSWSNGATSGAQTAYRYEVGANSSSTAYPAKIGLMYLSDYYYGATNTYWTYVGNGSSSTDYRAAASNNWMRLGTAEWTISRTSSDSSSAFNVRDNGVVNYLSVDSYFNRHAVRPSFYLNSSTTYAGGTGEASSPIRVS